MTNILHVCLSVALLLSYSLEFTCAEHNECSKGPVFWCANLRNAKQCHAVQHCIQTVWEKQILADDTGDVCKSCVGTLDKFKDSSADKLQFVIEALCAGITSKEVSSLCKNNVADLGDTLSHVLTSSTKTQTTCSALGLCNNDKIDNLLAIKKEKTVPTAGKLKPKDNRNKYLLGASRCTWGPSYWCENFRNARGCKATNHCIYRVWSKNTAPDDKDSVCQICTDMVKQARDQLESNQTQEDLKAVFEGSCKLIPLSIISNECIKLSDEFIPELVETLASQMNPTTVCTVAGLCNSQRIDNMLAEYQRNQMAEKQQALQLGSECNGCHRVVGVMRNKFDSLSYEQFLEQLLLFCRKLSSFSDACSMNVFVHFEEIHGAVKEHFNAANACHNVGVCSAKFHQHETENVDTAVEITPVGKTGVLMSQKDDTLPCELCEQLVLHLRDLLITNTTASEFQMVLKGICKQTGSFAEECLSLVSQYYPMVYQYLISDLKPDEVCDLAGLCKVSQSTESVQIAPLFPRELSVTLKTGSSKLMGTDEANSYTVPPILNSPEGQQANIRIVPQEAQPLPLERIFVKLPPSPRNAEICTFCQMFLHYLQVEISDSRNEEEVKTAVESACDRLPDAIVDECKQFVEAYGNAVISLLVQDIDPSSVCPGLGLCPKVEEVRKVGVAEDDKSTCPLCLFAAEQIETVLKNNKTEANIEEALDKLCTHLSDKLQAECTQFVALYSNALVQMILENFTPQDICVELKLCSDTTADILGLKMVEDIDRFHLFPNRRSDRNRYRISQSMLPKRMLEPLVMQIRYGGDIETNEIPDNTRNGRPIALGRPVNDKNPACVICEFVMTQLEQEISDKHNDDEIKKAVHGVCNHLPKTVTKECNGFVDKYADLVISLLAQELKPSEVCAELKLCDPNASKINVGILECTVCQAVVMAVDRVLSNPNVDKNIENILEKSCAIMPAKYYDRCSKIMETYGESIIHLIETIGADGVCSKIGLCGSSLGTYVVLK